MDKGDIEVWGHSSLNATGFREWSGNHVEEVGHVYINMVSLSNWAGPTEST